MALLVSDIDRRVRKLLADTDEIKYVESEFLDWFNEGTAETARLIPESASNSKEVAMAVGTMQTIPTGDSKLLTVIRNQVSGVAGRVVRLVDRMTLDEERPDWHSETSAAVVKRYVYDENDPKVFYVYPPNSGTGGLLITTSSAPTPVTALGDGVPIGDIYAALLVNYICYRAHAKNFTSEQSIAHSMRFEKAFMEGVAAQKIITAENDPNSKGG